jgi:hypothetical protein
MHAKCQREMVEKERKSLPKDAANSVKLTETANTVDSLAVQVECTDRQPSGCRPSPHMPMQPMGHSQFIERSISRTTLHVIPRLSGKHPVNTCTSQGMHVERHFEVIENTGE